MIEEVREHAGGALAADVCIVGAGPAGITLARELAGRGKSVVLAEGGGLGPEPESQALYEGGCTGLEYPVQATRLRYFGGSSGHWEGYSAPLNPIDFRRRAWVERSGWPFDEREMEPYWRRAHEVLDLGTFEYSPGVVRAARPYLELDAAKLVTRVWRMSPPTRFGEKYRAEIEASERVRCLLHANVLEFGVSADGGRIESVAFGDGEAEPARVRAEVFVVACGGLENPRVLLHMPERALAAMGPSAAMIGRCFMEHVHLGVGAMIMPIGDWWEAYARFEHEGTGVVAGIGLSEAAQEELRLQNLAAMVYPTPAPPALREGAACLTMHVVGEQAPNLDSRVTLAEERDALGLRKLRLRLAFGESDRRTVEEGALLLARELGRLGAGRVRIGGQATGGVFPKGMWPAAHHMGATRMAADPREGVVDAQARVHGIANLYVAGSSVFPTGGYANPTVNLVALAMRLGDYLATRL